MTIKVVVFDMGDTVMQDFPDYTGSMAQWPKVAAVPGAADALAALYGRYQLVLASNASASGETLARAALARIGLEGFFDHVLTARELGVCKPDPVFFDAILTECDCVPHQAVMVGDAFHTDVVGAKYAGLWAVWLNPSEASPPTEFNVREDVCIGSMTALPAAIQTLERRAGGVVDGYQ